MCRSITTWQVLRYHAAKVSMGQTLFKNQQPVQLQQHHQLTSLAAPSLLNCIRALDWVSGVGLVHGVVHESGSMTEGISS